MSRHIVLESIRRQQRAVNSSQQWQHSRSTRHNTVFQSPVNSSYDFGLWRVDRVTSWLAVVNIG